MNQLTTLAGQSRALTVVNAGRLTLRHPVFKTFDEPFFRISEVERKAVLVIRMDDRDVSLPVCGMMREFGIPADDADGLMLANVVRALDFVTGLRIGDLLPSEIMTGRASWLADDTYHEQANARLNLHLLAWMSGKSYASLREKLLQAGQSPVTKESLALGLSHLAAAVGGVTPEQVLGRLRQVAGEFAHIDALRDKLLRGAQRMGDVLNRLAHNFRGDRTHKELLTQVRRLAAIGITDLQTRFRLVDFLLEDIERVIRDPELVIAAIRKTRDELYVRCRAWDPYNMEWATIEAGHNARTWHLAHETYRFLAPRYMTIVEWVAAGPADAASKPAKSSMDW